MTKVNSAKSLLGSKCECDRVGFICVHDFIHCASLFDAVCSVSASVLLVNTAVPLRLGKEQIALGFELWR